MSLVYVDLEISLTPRACEMLAEVLFAGVPRTDGGDAESELLSMAALCAARARNVQHFRKVEEQTPDWLA